MNRIRSNIGWRGKIGLLIPQLNTVMEEEFHKMSPIGVSIHTTRMFGGKDEPGGSDLRKLSDGLEGNLNLFKDTGMDVIVFGCTSGSFTFGIEYAKELDKRIKKIAGVPGIITSLAVSEALNELNLRKVAIASPYDDWINQRAKHFYEKLGYKIVNIQSSMHDLRAEAAYRTAKKANVPEAEVVFISCTAFNTIDIINKLEIDLQKPVFSSNVAAMWSSLRKLEIREKIEDYGSLLKHL